MAQPALHHDELDCAVAEAVDRAGGDLLLAIRDLARRQHEMEGELRRSVSAGYVRRGLSARG